MGAGVSVGFRRGGHVLAGVMGVMAREAGILAGCVVGNGARLREGWGVVPACDSFSPAFSPRTLLIREQTAKTGPLSLHINDLGQNFP